MTPLAKLLHEARETGNYQALLDAVPYARFLGFEIADHGGELTGVMRYSDHLVGNANVDALHGGTLGALLELTAIFKLLTVPEAVSVPRTVNITVEFLRQGHRRDTFARAEFIRHGRRVANVRAWAWQDNPDKPVAAANAHFLV